MHHFSYHIDLCLRYIWHYHYVSNILLKVKRTFKRDASFIVLLRYIFQKTRQNYKTHTTHLFASQLPSLNKISVSWTLHDTGATKVVELAANASLRQKMDIRDKMNEEETRWRAKISPPRVCAHHLPF